MTINNEIELLKDQVGLLLGYFKSEEDKKRKKSKFDKVPSGVLARVRRGVKKNLVLVPYFGMNKNFSFKKGVVRENGLVEVDGIGYQYDPSSVHTYKNKIPVIGIIGWRISPVNGVVDAVKMSVNGDDDRVWADQHKLTNYAQLTIIREIEAKEADIVGKKKKPPVILWIIIGGVVIYLISKFFGGGV